MLKSEVREIDGIKFQVTQLPAMQSVKMLPRLVKLLGPALRKLAEGDVQSLKDLNVGMIADALVDLTEKIDGAVIEDLMKVFFAHTLVAAKEGQEPSAPLMPVFDMVLGGMPFTAYKLLAFAIEVNYQSFFAALRGRMAAAEVKAASSSKE